MLCSYVICHIYVRYLTTRYMMMQVAAIPPNRMYLSPSDLRSINLMTVLLMPKTEATSKTFFWMPFSVTLWSRRFSNIIWPWLSISSMCRWERFNASLCSRALSIRIDVSDVPRPDEAANALVVNLVCRRSFLSCSLLSHSLCLLWMAEKDDWICWMSYFSCSIRILVLWRLAGGSLFTRISSLSQLLK